MDNFPGWTGGWGCWAEPRRSRDQSRQHRSQGAQCLPVSRHQGKGQDSFPGEEGARLTPLRRDTSLPLRFRQTGGTKPGRSLQILGSVLAVVGWGTSLGTLCAKAIAPGELQDSGLLAQTSAPAPASESPSPPLPTLTLGDTGPLVLKLQYLLQQQGYYPGTPQGQFDRATQQAITEFERDRKLPVDGVADAQTWQALAGVSPPASAQGAEAGQPPSQQPPAPAQTPPTPSSQDSGSQDSSPQDSTTQNPSAQNPGTQNPTTQNPSAQNPSTQNPSTQNPSTQNPDPQPLWRNPLILVLVGFMACGIVGIWGAILWANSRNSRSRDPQDQGSNPSDPANPADPFLDTPAPLEIPAPKASTLRCRIRPAVYWHPTPALHPWKSCR